MWLACSQVNRDDDLASADDYLQVAQWNPSALQRKLDKLSLTPSMRAAGATERFQILDLLTWLLQPEPKKRPGSFRDILTHAFFRNDGKWCMSDLHVKVATEDDDAFHLPPSLTREDLNSSFHLLGLSPLHVAVAEMKPRAVGLLIERGADTNAVDCTGRTPFDHLLGQLKQPRRPDQQLQILRLLSRKTEYSKRQPGSAETKAYEHLPRADHLVRACEKAHEPWNAHLAQLLLQQSAENSWMDACERLIDKGAKLDEPSPWDVRLPRQIGMASSLPQIRDLFQKHGTVCIVAHSSTPLSRIFVAQLVTATASLVCQFIDRYLFGDPIHSSATCTVVEAIDITDNDEKVVIKLMKNPVQLVREIENRRTLSEDAVVMITASSEDEHLRERWVDDATKRGYAEYPCGIVMKAGQRNLMVILVRSQLPNDIRKGYSRENLFTHALLDDGPARCKNI